MKHIGDAIRFIRQSMNLEQKDVAARSGLARSFISAIEMGSRDPSWTSIRKICDALNIEVSMATLLLEGGKDSIKPFVPLVYARLWEKAQESHDSI